MKHTDFVIRTTKGNMICDGMKNLVNEYDGLHSKYLNRSNVTFTSWISLSTTLKKTKEGTAFSSIPTIEEIRDTFISHRESVIESIFRHHTLLIEKKDNFYCSDYDNTETELPNKLDFKY